MELNSREKQYESKTLKVRQVLEEERKLGKEEGHSEPRSPRRKEFPNTCGAECHREVNVM